MEQAVRPSKPMTQPHFDDVVFHSAAILRAALSAADAADAVRRHLRLAGDCLFASNHQERLLPGSRVYLVALGKAAPAMARAAVEVLGDRLTRGVAAVPDSEPVPPPPRIRFIRGGHPLPDQGSLAAGRAAATMLEETRRGDIVLALVSGGGSSMFELLVDGLDLQALRSLTGILLRSGAPIEAVNEVRKALSRVKAGGLARLAAPARVVALILSDVVGDRISAVASGPTVLRAARPEQARAILKRHVVWSEVPEHVRRALRRPVKVSPRVPRPRNVLIGSNRQVVEAAGCQAAEMEFEARTLTTRMEGEARDVGWRFGGRLAEIAQARPARTRPLCLLMGGETTVTVRGHGRGGRNQELALGAALALEGISGVTVMALATDGVDGPTDAAGAAVTGVTATRARGLGVDPLATLEANDSYPLLDALGALVRTGRTGTNLNDLVVGLVYPEARMRRISG